MANTPPKKTATPTSKSAARKPAAKPATKRPTAKRPATKAAASTQRAPAKPKARPVAKPTADAAAHKPKQKLVRDSFTMPQPDFELIGALKKRALSAGHAAKKSELLRAGLQALTRLDDQDLRTALEALVKLKAGRPAKDR